MLSETWKQAEQVAAERMRSLGLTSPHWRLVRHAMAVRVHKELRSGDPCCDYPDGPCETPECQHRCCACGHVECGHANEHVQPNCADCDCNGFKWEG